MGHIARPRGVVSMGGAASSRQGREGRCLNVQCTISPAFILQNVFIKSRFYLTEKIKAVEQCDQICLSGGGLDWWGGIK